VTSRRLKQPGPVLEPDPNRIEDTALTSLSKADRRKLSMDAWEPSLLRKLLAAQNRLKAKRE
jgi:hypothetical protein